MLTRAASAIAAFPERPAKSGLVRRLFNRTLKFLCTFLQGRLSFRPVSSINVFCIAGDTMSLNALPITKEAKEPLLARSVDVIIAAWNREDTIERAAASALAEPEVQSVIVVDDGSTDGTAVRARAADDGSKRLTVLRFPENKGPAAARNAALKECAAPWITILDGDDYLLPGRFSQLLALAQGWDLIADDILQVGEDRIDVDVPLPMLAAGGSFEPWQCSFETFVRGNITKKGRNRKELGFFKPLIRRAFLDTHDLRYDEALRLGEDYALYGSALAAGARFQIVPALGYVSVMRPGSLSGNHSKRDLEQLRDFDLILLARPALSAVERAAVREHYRSVDARAQWLEIIDAVKARDARRFFGAYCRSPKVARFISARLAEQLLERSAKRLKALTRGKAPLELSGSQN